MSQVVTRISDMLSIGTNSSRLGYSYESILNEVSCSKIQKHFAKSSLLSMVEWEDYVNSLHNCPLSKIMLENVTSANFHEKARVHRTMLTNYVNQFYYNQMYHHHVQKAVFLNAYSAFQTGLLSELNMIKSNWQDGIRTCESGLFPTELVNESILKSSISKIETLINSDPTLKGYELSIKNSSERIRDYVGLSLTDCVIREDKKLIIRLQVPIVRSSSSAKSAFKIKPIPFIRKSISSAGNSNTESFEICEFKEETLGDISNLRLVPTPNSLGYIQAIQNSKNSPLFQVRGDLVNECLANLLSNNTEYITNNCAMTCTKAQDKSDLPHFRRISSDTWIILEKRSNHDLFVNCNSKPVKMVSSLREAGTLRVTLPCNCQLLHRTKSFNSSQACGSSLKITVIKPHFFNRRDVTSVTQISEDEATTPQSTTLESVEEINIAEMESTTSQSYASEGSSSRSNNMENQTP